MKDKLESLKFWLDHKCMEDPCVLATIIRTEGSTYRKSGTIMIVSKDESVGLLSGGCFENEIHQIARGILRDQPTLDHGSTSEWKPGIVRIYDMSDETDIVFGSGSGCAGKIEILFEALSFDLSALEEREIFLLESRDHSGKLPVELVYETQEGPLQHVLFKRSANEGSEATLFLECAPIPEVCIFGAGDDVIPIANFASELGWQLTIVDHRAHLLTCGRFPKANRKLCGFDALDEGFLTTPINLVMTHNLLHDLSILTSFSKCKNQPQFLGMLGSHNRIELLQKISQGMIGQDFWQSVTCPVGLNQWPTHSPESIALSIVASIQRKIDAAQIDLSPPTKPSRIACVVLAAGGSRRLGEPKQELIYRDRSLLEDAVQKAKLLNPYLMRVVLNEAIHRPHNAGTDEVLLNRDWEQGIGSSIRLSLNSLVDDVHVDGVMFLLCDQPLIPLSHYHKLTETFSRSHQIVATSYGGSVGVPAVFPKIYFEELVQIPAKSGAKKVLMNHLREVIQIPCEQAQFDIDTPKDKEILQPITPSQRTQVINITN